MTGRTAGKLKGSKVKVLTPGRLGTQLVAQVGAYLAVSGPMGVQLVSELDKGILEKFGLAKGNKEYIMKSEWLERPKKTRNMDNFNFQRCHLALPYPHCTLKVHAEHCRLPSLKFQKRSKH